MVGSVVHGRDEAAGQGGDHDHRDDPAAARPAIPCRRMSGRCHGCQTCCGRQRWRRCRRGDRHGRGAGTALAGIAAGWLWERGGVWGGGVCHGHSLIAAAGQHHRPLGHLTVGRLLPVEGPSRRLRLRLQVQARSGSKVRSGAGYERENPGSTPRFASPCSLAAHRTPGVACRDVAGIESAYPAATRQVPGREGPTRR